MVSTGEGEVMLMDNEQRIKQQSEFVMALHKAAHQKEYDHKEKIALSKLGKKNPRKAKQITKENK